MKVKNELGYTAYDLSLRGGETGGNFVAEQIFSLKAVSLPLFCIAQDVKNAESCCKKRHERILDFQGPR